MCCAGERIVVGMRTNEIRDIVADLRAGWERGEFKNSPSGEKYLGRALRDLERVMGRRTLWERICGYFN